MLYSYPYRLVVYMRIFKTTTKKKIPSAERGGTLAPDRSTSRERSGRFMQQFRPALSDITKKKLLQQQLLQLLFIQHIINYLYFKHLLFILLLFFFTFPLELSIIDYSNYSYYSLLLFTYHIINYLYFNNLLLLYLLYFFYTVFSLFYFSFETFTL